MTTEATATSRSPRLHRYSRGARWLHALTYLATAVELATGWWLLGGQEGHPSLLASLTSLPDTTIHVRVGIGLLVLALGGVALAARSSWFLLRQSLLFRPSDVSWLRAWPRAAVTGDFGRHDGFFDPGQRVANLVMLGGIAVLVGSGTGLAVLHGGDLFVAMLWLHKAATYIVTPVVAGHVVVASGVLPGYRGVWRSMHGGGGIDSGVAERLWPAWAERAKQAPADGGNP